MNDFEQLFFSILSNNNLDGPIPDSIIQKYQDGSLDLRFVCTIP
jgi:hypothetical protein